MEEVTAVLNTTVVLHCDVTGHPAPTVSWLKDGQPVRPDSSAHLRLSEDGTQLQVGHPGDALLSQRTHDWTNRGGVCEGCLRVTVCGVSPSCLASRCPTWLGTCAWARTRWGPWRNSSASQCKVRPSLMEDSSVTRRSLLVVPAVKRYCIRACQTVINITWSDETFVHVFFLFIDFLSSTFINPV